MNCLVLRRTLLLSMVAAMTAVVGDVRVAQAAPIYHQDPPGGGTGGGGTTCHPCRYAPTINDCLMTYGSEPCLCCWG